MEKVKRLHELKVLPMYYTMLVNGTKLFELRKNDRDFRVGDVLILQEWDGNYSGRSLRKRITYILSDCSQYGLMDGYVILSLSTKRVR